MNYIKTAWMLLCLFVIAPSHAIKPDTFTYQHELHNFDAYGYDKPSFGAKRSLKTQQQKIKESFIVTPHNLPHLYAYVESICNKANIKMPMVYVVRNKLPHNACASSSAVWVDETLINKFPDNELEAVMAHEVGHIKHNHCDKIEVARTVISFLGASCMTYIMYGSSQRLKETGLTLLNEQRLMEEGALIGTLATILITSMLSMLAIERRYEREADQFAYQDMDKGEGLIHFHERKEQEKIQFFKQQQEIIKKHESNLARLLYRGRYYFMKTTMFSTHPSPAARIAAAKQYLEQQEG